MRALICDNGLRYDPAYPEPVPPPGEALIRVRLAGICNTDLELVRGYLGFRGVMGHEFVGEVVQAADATWLGRRVVGDINAACRSQECVACTAGRPTHCPNRTTLGIAGRDGAFAEYLILPQANLYAVPKNVSDEMAVFTEPLAAACEILAQIQIAPTDRVVVLGDGKLGLLVAAVLRLTGAELTLVGRHQDKLAIAEDWGVPGCRCWRESRCWRTSHCRKARSMSSWNAPAARRVLASLGAFCARAAPWCSRVPIMAR